MLIWMTNEFTPSWIFEPELCSYLKLMLDLLSTRFTIAARISHPVENFCNYLLHGFNKS